MKAFRNSFFALFVLFAFVLAACGGGGGPTGGTTTPPAPATVVSLAPTSVGYTQATLNARVNTQNDNCELYWLVSPDNTFAHPSPTPYITVNTGTNTGDYGIPVDNLAEATTYWAKPCLVTDNGTILGAVVTVTTGLSGTAPTVATLGYDNVTRTSARVYMSAIPNGKATRVRFRHGTDPTLASYQVTGWVNIGAGAVSVQVSELLSGLAANARRYYQSEGENVHGAPLGTIQSFITGSGLAPQVLSLTITSTTTGTLSARMNVDPRDPVDGGSGCLDWSLDNVSWTALANQSFAAGSTVDLDFLVTGQTSDTVIYLRGRVDNPWGSDMKYASGRTQAVSGTGTINVKLDPYMLLDIFRYGVKQTTLDGAVLGSGWFSYTGTAGDGYMFVLVNRLAHQAYSIWDLSNNNVFNLPAGAVLNLHGTSSVVNGHVLYNTSGSGWTSTYRGPVANISSLPAWTVTTAATDNNYFVPSPSVVTAIYSQTDDLVSFNDPYIGTVYGTMNGDLLYFWAFGYNGAEYIVYRETVLVNAAGNRFYGDMRLDLTGTGRWVTGTVSGAR